MANFGADDLRELSDQLDQLRDEAEEAERRVEAALDAAVQRTAFQVERMAKQRAPVDTDTLRASIETRKLDTSKYVVGTSVEYAPAVEFGSGPHPITPDDADALRFPGPDGNPVFATRVEHPGTPAQPFLRPALREGERDLASEIRDEIQELFDEVFD
jgi:HK97 gp10 family phage protein